MYRHRELEIGWSWEHNTRRAQAARFQGSGFRVQGSGIRVQGSGFRVQGSGFRDQGSGFRVQGSGFRVQGSGFKVWGSGRDLDDVGLALLGVEVGTTTIALPPDSGG